MSAGGPAYRATQFWRALTARPSPAQLADAKALLGEKAFALFHTLQPSEQAHALAVAAALRVEGHQDEAFLAGALLHDVGKARYPLRIWERVLIVLGQAFAPRKAVAWGKGEPRGWRRAFVIAAQHPEWGAQMAAETGLPAEALELIRRHQEPPPKGNTQLDRWLRALQAVDDQN